MGLPQSSTRARHNARPGASELPASTQAQRSSGTPLAAHAAHDELTTSQRRLKSCRLRRQRRGPRVSTQGPAPPLTGRRSPRQPGGTPTLLPSFNTKEHAPTQTCSRLILRADTNRRRRDRAFQQLHVPGARGAHQHEGFPTILVVGTHRPVALQLLILALRDEVQDKTAGIVHNIETLWDLDVGHLGGDLLERCKRFDVRVGLFR